MRRVGCSYVQEQVSAGLVGGWCARLRRVCDCTHSWCVCVCVCVFWALLTAVNTLWCVFKRETQWNIRIVKVLAQLEQITDSVAVLLRMSTNYTLCKWVVAMSYTVW